MWSEPCVVVCSLPFCDLDYYHCLHQRRNGRQDARSEAGGMKTRRSFPLDRSSGESVRLSISNSGSSSKIQSCFLWRLCRIFIGYGAVEFNCLNRQESSSSNYQFFTLLTFSFSVFKLRTFIKVSSSSSCQEWRLPAASSSKLALLFRVSRLCFPCCSFPFPLVSSFLWLSMLLLISLSWFLMNSSSSRIWSIFISTHFYDLLSNEVLLFTLILGCLPCLYSSLLDQH